MSISDRISSHLINFNHIVLTSIVSMSCIVTSLLFILVLVPDWLDIVGDSYKIIVRINIRMTRGIFEFRILKFRNSKFGMILEGSG